MKDKKTYRLRTYKSVFLLMPFLILYSLIFPNKLILVDEIRLSLESFFLPIICYKTIGKEYTDRENNPIEGPTDIKFQEIDFYRKTLEPGDLLFTSNRRYLGTTFISGKWKHASVYLGTKEKLISTFGVSSPVYNCLKVYFKTGKEELIIDSDLNGVHAREFSSLFFYRDISYLQSITAFRLNIPTQRSVHFLENVFQQINKNYDFDLLTYNSKSIYCSELLFDALSAININLEVPSKIANRKVVMPTDIVQFFTKKIASTNQFSFLFFLEKKDYRIVTRPINDVL